MTLHDRRVDACECLAASVFRGILPAVPCGAEPCRGTAPVSSTPPADAATVGYVTTLSDIQLTTIDGATTGFSHYSDRVLLVVNVASRCGFAPQYEKLEALQKRFGDRGFTVLGFPSNQFLQELGTDDAIKQYCATTWGVTFPIFQKTKVNGTSAHPLYQELVKTKDAAGKAGRVAWNFEKFLLLPNGDVHRFRTRVQPDAPEIVSLIEAALP